MVEIAKLTVIVLAVFIFIGGIIGFIKAKSKPSLISGIISSGLLAGCYTWSQTDAKIALITADVLSVLLTVMFYFRFTKSRKFMPAGLLILLCSLAVVVITMAVTGS
ncbi:MAG: TMEM14 family protein [Candidatus Obscuribacterales bacterium]|nr:TMEM14 family protein [Candidatus Obscuribacterales bacterium]